MDDAPQMTEEPKNYIVLRRSPDWLNFDMEDTRKFLSEFPLPNDMIIEFAKLWDDQMGLSYKEYRHSVKLLATHVASNVSNSILISTADVGSIDFNDEDRIFFTDDDDWVSPDLFQFLEKSGPAEHGWIWNSIFVGKLFGQTPFEGPAAAVIEERPSSNVIYTNNYAVTGRFLKSQGQERVEEHYHSQILFDNGSFKPARLNEYLSAANKHLCCTVCIHYNGSNEGFMQDMAKSLNTIVLELEAIELTERSAWIGRIKRQFNEINKEALGR